ncbi:hypothetical protein D3C87_1215630 [compost metagenome]
MNETGAAQRHWRFGGPIEVVLEGEAQVSAGVRVQLHAIQGQRAELHRPANLILLGRCGGAGGAKAPRVVSGDDDDAVGLYDRRSAAFVRPLGLQFGEIDFDDDDA